MPSLVATSRLYRGEHHPTDLMGSVVMAALWLTATYLAVRPNADLDDDRGGVAPSTVRDGSTVKSSARS